jgi:hypothetical protein
MLSGSFVTTAWWHMEKETVVSFGYFEAVSVAKLKGRYTWDTKRGAEDNIKVDFEGLERGGLDWMKLTQDRIQ